MTLFITRISVLSRSLVFGCSTKACDWSVTAKSLPTFLYQGPKNLLLETVSSHSYNLLYLHSLRLENTKPLPPLASAPSSRPFVAGGCDGFDLSGGTQCFHCRAASVWTLPQALVTLHASKMALPLLLLLFCFEEGAHGRVREVFFCRMTQIGDFFIKLLAEMTALKHLVTLQPQLQVDDHPTC